jgi:hypothetical protein
MWLDGRREPHYRLSYEDLTQLPHTFGSADVTDTIGVQGKLAINTGCWIAKLGQDWNRKVAFHLESGIDWCEDGSPYVFMLAEDWHFSRQLHNLGCYILATQAITLAHHGATAWTIRDMSGAW